MNGYGDAAPLYLAAGWSAPLPLPPRRKAWPPTGYTGHNGTRPGRDQIERWRTDRADWNICLRLGNSVIGLDLDLYKQPDARTRLEELLGGPLPPTWCSTSRDDGSGIYLYRVPPAPAGKRWSDTPVAGVEVVQRGHRYVVCWPSLHPEGRLYRWRDPSGEVADRAPDPDDCTFLDGYSPLLVEVDARTDREPVEFDLTDGDPSEAVAARLRAGMEACASGRGSRHDAVRGTVAALVRLAERGEPGVTAALAELGQAFVNAVGPDRPGGRRHAEHEYDDLVHGAVTLVSSTEPVNSNGEPSLKLTIVTDDAFAAVEEEGAEALLGDDDNAVIPANGTVMFYGDGGAGKTTLVVDLAYHLKTPADWLGMTVPRALNVGLIENEGPRPQFRKKIRRKRAGWNRGGEPAGRIHIVQAPWAQLRFDNEAHRRALAQMVTDHELDAVIIGPVNRAGMDAPGTLAEVNAFLALVDDVRRRCGGRRVTFILIHHENRAGQVSGAWEGATDTLFHVLARGHGQTRLFVQKARWASNWHGRKLDLAWAEGEGFAVEDTPKLTDDDLAQRILGFVASHPATGWTPVSDEITGVERRRKAKVRDYLLAAEELVNVVSENGVEVATNRVEQKKAARLYVASDPTIQHLRRTPGADAAQTELDLG